MLLRFGVANHRSIRDYQELLLSASKHVKHEYMTVPVPTIKESIVPIVAIYGPNAAGKSNLIDAIDEMQRAILHSHTRLGATDRISRYAFRLDRTGETPTKLDCTFTVDELGSGKPESVYEYGFEFTATEFQREWLYRIVRKERLSTQILFERRTEDKQVIVDFGSHLRGENKTISKLTRPNSLFLSAAAQNNHPQLTALHKYFSSQWKIMLREGVMNDASVAESLFNYRHIDRLLRLVRQADLGITKIDVKEEEPDEDQIKMVKEVYKTLKKHLKIPDEVLALDDESIFGRLSQPKRLRLVHSTLSKDAQPFEYGMESKGTRTLISLLIPALEALSTGALLVIDEIDTSLHPNLTRSLVSLFKRKESNPLGAQLIFSTHDVSLLGSGLIQQDEIWITDKDNEGVSRFKPLTEFKLRSRDNIEKAYRRGRFSGIPPTDEFFIEFRDNWVSSKT